MTEPGGDTQTLYGKRQWPASDMSSGSLLEGTGGPWKMMNQTPVMCSASVVSSVWLMGHPREFVLYALFGLGACFVVWVAEATEPARKHLVISILSAGIHTPSTGLLDLRFTPRNLLSKLGVWMER